MITWTVIFVSVLGTSILSGVIGMAGGLLLMGVLVSLLPVAGAMIVHGAVQAHIERRALVVLCVATCDGKSSRPTLRAPCWCWPGSPP